MKSVILALLLAATAQAVIYRLALREYSEALGIGLFVVAVIGAVVLGIFASRPFMAFCGSVALAAPAISYSMVGYGLLEMGGFFHAFALGGLGAFVHKLAHGFSLSRRPEGSTQ